MRRRSRECALQILYQLDLNQELSRTPPEQEDPWLTQAMNAFWLCFDAEVPVDRAFTDRLVRGVVGHLAFVDDAIDAASKHWKLSRMTAVDRNLLRVAAYEILSCPDIPSSASINEALEIAKRFGGGESVAFINGILDHIAKTDTKGLVAVAEQET